MRWRDKLTKIPDEDKRRIIQLGQTARLNEDQFRQNLIGRAEYEKTCDMIMKELVDLEEKYGS